VRSGLAGAASDRGRSFAARSERDPEDRYPPAVPQSKSKRSRYTPPPQKKAPASPLWMGVAITTLLLVGLVVVVTNYLGLLPGEAENRYLIIGLVLISTGFMMATGYR
jgi:hypothetical protein